MLVELRTYSNDDLDTVAIGLPPFLVGIMGLGVVNLLIYFVVTAKGGNEKMEKIHRAIQLSAMQFLKLEYTALTVAALCLFVLIAAAVHWKTAICYLCGAFTSAFCGFIGMWICTTANVKTAAAAEHGLNQALRVSFNAGSVMGLTVVSLGLGAIAALLMIFDRDAVFEGGEKALTGFGMGASTVSIFSRVGGGIFTKAADVGADLVGKVEKDLPEDDVRNPATIADNVGDNVGDVAGMGADLFSSFVGSIIASSLLGYTNFGEAGVALPYWISMSGIIAAVIGMMTVRCEEGATQHDLLNVLRRAQFIAGIFQVGFIAIVVAVLDLSWKLFGCIVIGLAAGLSIGLISEYFTSYAYAPTQNISKSARIGAANVIIEGLSVGMYSCVAPALIIASVVLAVYSLAGDVYGIALASTGLLSTLGITLATDAYGPVADNAGGIAEMTHMPEQTRRNTDVLDALGNTTAAIGKGFAVGSAVLTALSLLTTFAKNTLPRTLDNKPSINAVSDEYFLAGTLIGAMLPYFFGALTMGAVNKAAQAVVVEVRRQFREIKGLMEGTVDPDYASCITMITTAALHSMVFPALLCVLSPIIVGVGLGAECLAGLLIGAIIGGFMLGGMMSAAGGAWDNGKKYIEAGNFGGKHSLAHKGAVVGDTVGDPFKDTSGPALNIQIKLMSYISVVLSPVFKNQANYWWAALILLGLLAIFIPVWIHLTPVALREETIETNVLALEAAKKKEEAEAEAANKKNVNASQEQLHGGDDKKQMERGSSLAQMNIE